jgi:peptide/nickel transport system substrate-binding protein
MNRNRQHLLTSPTRRHFLGRALAGLGAATSPNWMRFQMAIAQPREPRGQMTWAIQANIAPSWLDPAETPGIATPYIFLYALHDALVKPMPGRAMAPSLASTWSESADGVTYEFVLRQGLTFHNGDAFTAEDVKFSYERYKGTGAVELRKKVKAVTVVHPHLVRFTLYEPWPDFLTYYATPATGASWIVPRNYTERIGNEKFKEQPVGLGPYRFVHFRPTTRHVSSRSGSSGSSMRRDRASRCQVWA